MMETENLHLTETAGKALFLSKDERVEYILKDRWIGYTRAKEAMDKLEMLLVHPKVQRMPNLLLVGDTNNGKTSIVKRFTKKHPPDDDIWEKEHLEMPVLYVEIDATPSEDSLYCEILLSLFSPFTYSMPTAKKREQAYRLLRNVGVKLLVIDEIHNLLSSRKEKQQGLLNAIKRLGNTLQISIVAVGTVDAARAIHSDPQMANRFEPFALSQWGDNEEYWRLLASLEKMLPLKHPSDLSGEKISRRILAMSEGRIGEITQLLKLAAVNAVRTGKEKIDECDLIALDWTPPSKRRVAAERYA